jgi:aryl-phospho-beta-D-glucosidase BglC (GH1 family)
MALFHAFYKNDLGIQDKFVTFWDVVSKRLSKNEFVIGFDPLNEPIPSSIWRNPALKLPKRFDKTELTPLYEKIFQKYKENQVSADEPNIMFFEPAQWPDFSKKSWLYPNGTVHSLGFKTPPGGQIGSTSHVLNDHSYCCQLSDDVCATGEPAAEMGDECLAWHFKRISTRAEDARKLGVPLIISEFGACLDSDECVREINQVAEACDDMIYHVSGWAYWICCSSFSINC